MCLLPLFAYGWNSPGSGFPVSYGGGGGGQTAGQSDVLFTLLRPSSYPLLVQCLFVRPHSLAHTWAYADTHMHKLRKWHSCVIKHRSSDGPICTTSLLACVFLPVVFACVMVAGQSVGGGGGCSCDSFQDNPSCLSSGCHSSADANSDGTLAQMASSITPRLNDCNSMMVCGGGGGAFRVRACRHILVAVPGLRSFPSAIALYTGDGWCCTP